MKTTSMTGTMKTTGTTKTISDIAALVAAIIIFGGQIVGPFITLFLYWIP